jgi:hypothetical protein
MVNENDKYSRIVDLLRRSEPLPGSAFEIERVVMERITSGKEGRRDSLSFIDILFGWVNIAWVRRSLVTISILLLVFFAWQQNTILKQVSFMANQIEKAGRFSNYDPDAALEKKKTLYRISEEFPGNVTLPAGDLNMLIDSLNELNIRYRDLLDYLEKDSSLRRSLEEFNRKSKSKIKL